MNILEKAELTASKSGIPFTIPKFLTRLAEKREEEEEHRQLQSVMCSTHTQKWEESLLTNSRSISVLSCFSKVLEHTEYNRIYNFLVDNEILFENQFGFQTAHFTKHAIL